MEELESCISKACSPDVSPGQRDEAFGKLVELFQDTAYQYAYAILGDSQLAQDITQEAFLTAYEKLGQLREPKAFPGWLKRIVLTHCNRLRRGKHLSVEPFEEITDIPTIEPDPANIIEVRDLEEKTLAAVETLPDHERVVVRLFYLQEYTTKEIAWCLHLPVTTIKKRLQYAREHMRENIIETQGVTLMACQIRPINIRSAIIISVVALLQRFPTSGVDLYPDQSEEIDPKLFDYVVEDAILTHL
jgi:RNA polymerase sigma factor (sigma-70 family)